VAKLLGIQNHFEGVFESAAPGADWGTLHWGSEPGGLKLRVLDKRRIDDGARVSWVIAGEHLQMRASEANADDAGGNDSASGDVGDWVDCVLEDALTLGEITRCKARTVAAPRDQLIVNVPTNTLREAALHPGDPVQVRIEPHGVHIMPTRGASKVRATTPD
jgi:molybdate transport system ATP-binding protein